ncbi:MAG TPA: hypothetical protein VL122_03620 [Nitrospirota bacterium]|nr:hypothetical protein [Nitrospirota bacterium]
MIGSALWVNPPPIRVHSYWDSRDLLDTVKECRLLGMKVFGRVLYPTIPTSGV